MITELLQLVELQHRVALAMKEASGVYYGTLKGLYDRLEQEILDLQLIEVRLEHANN